MGLADVLLGSEIKACRHVKYWRHVKYDCNGLHFGICNKTNWIKNLKSTWNRKIVRHAGIATVMHCVVLLLELLCGRNNPGSQVFQRTLFVPKSMDWILNSHRVWMIQTTDTLLLDCKQNVTGSMGAICKSSIPAYVLEWVGQWSVTLRRITERLSCLILFHNIMEQLEDKRTLKMLTYKAREQHHLKHAIRETVFKLQNPYSGRMHVTQREISQHKPNYFYQRFNQHNTTLLLFFFSPCFDRVRCTLSPFMTSWN